MKFYCFAVEISTKVSYTCGQFCTGFPWTLVLRVIEAGVRNQKLAAPRKPEEVNSDRQVVAISTDKRSAALYDFRHGLWQKQSRNLKDETRSFVCLFASLFASLFVEQQTLAAQTLVNINLTAFRLTFIFAVAVRTYTKVPLGNDYNGHRGWLISSHENGCW